jgi:hypothetical protein
VSTHTDSACPGASDVTANEQKIHDHRDVINAIALLRYAQAPRDDGLL